jgi:hypothetical protein
MFLQRYFTVHMPEEIHLYFFYAEVNRSAVNDLSAPLSATE